MFAVNHKELKKRNAWVVNFDMTDYTGSIRVNRFMEADQAKPLIDAIQKPGKWLRVQGFISFSRFENDIVLEPLAVQAAEAPVRVDTAPEKRVELHLHTTMSMMDALTKTGEAVATAARWGPPRHCHHGPRRCLVVPGCPECLEEQGGGDGSEHQDPLWLRGLLCQ